MSGWVPSPNAETQDTPNNAEPIEVRNKKGNGFVRGLEYYNPDPIAHLIGPANETDVLVDGQQVTALLDTGANMSCMTKWLAEEMELEIHLLQRVLNIEGIGGGRVPYHGYVECQLQFLGDCSL